MKRPVSQSGDLERYSGNREVAIRPRLVVLAIMAMLTGQAVSPGLLAAQLPDHTSVAQQETPTVATDRRTAPQLVREGNRLLLGEKPAEALDAYEKAKALKPDAREIAFGEGLARYRLGEYEKARDAFERAAGGAADALADDALYSIGTCDHAAALETPDPKAALAGLESAMRSYQSVLAERPDHAPARDANLKAGSYWRQLKQQLQQQQQQQQEQQQSSEEKDQQQNQDQRQDQEQQQKSQEQKQEPSQQEPPQENSPQSAEDQARQEQQDQEQQRSSAENQQDQQDAQAERPREDPEAVSREQAERKLREMVQALRDRNKRRREEVRSPAYRPTEKDW